MDERLRTLRRAAGVHIGLLGTHRPRKLKLDQEPLPARTTNWPAIAIVTPVRNQADFIGHTVFSVLSQEGGVDLQYVVQDGGSTDGTLQLLSAVSDPRMQVHSEPDDGQADALNRGFGRTPSEIMAWLNGDDILLPGALASVAHFFATHPEVDVVYGHRVLIDRNGDKIGEWVMPPHDDRILSWFDFIPQETLFWRRRIWVAAGGYIDTSFDFAVDWDLLVRFRAAGARFARLPRFLGAFRVHDAQKTNRMLVERGRKEMERIRQRCLGRTPSTAEAMLRAIPYLGRHALLGWRMRLTNRLL